MSVEKITDSPEDAAESRTEGSLHGVVSRLVDKLGSAQAEKAIKQIEEYFDGVTSKKQLTTMLNRMAVIDDSSIDGG